MSTDLKPNTIRIINNPNIIKDKVIRIFCSNNHSSVLGQKIGKYFQYLEERDIINDYKISINEIEGKLHVSWEWIYGHYSFTLPLKGKITSLPMKVKRSNYKENN